MNAHVFIDKERSFCRIIWLFAKHLAVGFGWVETLGAGRGQRNFRHIRLAYKPYFTNEHYFSLITNQPIVLSDMAYQPSEHDSCLVGYFSWLPCHSKLFSGVFSWLRSSVLCKNKWSVFPGCRFISVSGVGVFVYLYFFLIYDIPHPRVFEKQNSCEKYIENSVFIYCWTKGTSLWWPLNII